MSEEKVINKAVRLTTDREVSMGDRTFTRLMGGFGNDKAMFTVWQAGDLLNITSREVT